MWVSCILRSGLLFVTLSLAIAKQKQSPFAESCYPRGTLSQAVDTLYVKAASLRATIPEDRIKNIRLLKKKTKKLFMKNCRFQEQLLSFFMEDVFGQLQLQVCKEMHFVEEFHSLRQKLSRCGLCGISWLASVRSVESVQWVLLVIAFLPRNKHLLISWLQPSSAMILEPPKIKSATVSLSIYLP
ncbi:hypothetical protein FD754_005795 [Muntiacus muntjak]|uniref:Interleukin 26 n=1 Tax=Muntiacus muntjak TaxID=9888 RepID=A0A5N3WIN7_MUNMU|nr:hypothetical protein FD754_005795 [Muntiacus muntjak]